MFNQYYHNRPQFKPKLPQVKESLYFSAEEFVKNGVAPLGIHKVGGAGGCGRGNFQIKKRSSLFHPPHQQTWRFHNVSNPDVQLLSSFFSPSPFPFFIDWATTHLPFLSLPLPPTPTSLNPPSIPPPPPSLLQRFLDLAEQVCVSQVIQLRPPKKRETSKNQNQNGCPRMPFSVGNPKPNPPPKSEVPL